MVNLLILGIIILFFLPAPLLLLAAFFNRKEMKQKTFDTNIKELWSAIISAGTSLFVAILTRPFTFLDRIPLTAKADDNRPILLVHGLYHNKMAWLPMKHRLNRQGFANLRTWQYNSFTTSYPELVLELRKEIKKIHNSSCRPDKITLIGHSLGGLIISGAAEDPETKEMVQQIITLGTPFRGSVLARIAPGRLGQSLHPGSSLFKGENPVKYPEGISKTAIISPTDEMVLPSVNLEPLSTSWRIIRCGAMGHVAMLYSSRVTRIVAECIRKR